MCSSAFMGGRWYRGCVSTQAVSAGRYAAGILSAVPRRFHEQYRSLCSGTPRDRWIGSRKATLTVADGKGEINIRMPYLQLIADGIKTVEVRVGYPRMRSLQSRPSDGAARHPLSVIFHSKNRHLSEGRGSMLRIASRVIPESAQRE